MPGFVAMETRVCLKENLTGFPHTCYKYMSENRFIMKILCLQKPYFSEKAIMTLFENAPIILLGIKKNINIWTYTRDFCTYYIIELRRLRLVCTLRQARLRILCSQRQSIEYGC